MRIFQIIEASATAAVLGNRTWYRNLYEPLVEMGHDVILFPAEEGRRAMQHHDPQMRAAFSQRVWELFRQEHARKPFDLFFAYLTDGMIDPGVLDEIRKIGVPTCNFSCNNAHQFDLVEEISSHFDYCLHSEKDASEKFRKSGANPLWWPMASNPKYFKPVDVPRSIPASFVGANYALRARYLAHLLENGIDAHAFGPGWVWGASSRWRSLAKRYKYLLVGLSALSPQTRSTASGQLADHDFRRNLAARFPENLHPPTSDEELVALYSRSHISLGFLEVYDQHDPGRPVTQHLHLREFEAPMCGALCCTGYMDELAEMFEPDREVVVYRSQHELLDKVRYYLTHPDQAEKVRLGGRARAMRDHTCHRRYEQLFSVLGLSKRL